MQQALLPLVLRKREPVVDFDDMGGIYDDARDIWVDDAGTPLVSTPRPQPTMLTESREGIDQSEHHERLSTRVGESMNTFTREGIDQPEHPEPVTPRPNWGRTLITATREGIDSTEGQVPPRP